MTVGPPARPVPGDKAAAADRALDAALADIAAVKERDVHDHVEVYERAHEALKARLEAESA